MTCLKFGITGVLPLNIVGNQYADRSSGARHDVAPTPAPCSDCSVVYAFVVVLPVKLCSCDAPGRLGSTIGSSDSRCVTSQLTWNSWCVTSSAGSAAAGVLSSATTASPAAASARCRLIGCVLLLGRGEGERSPTSVALGVKVALDMRATCPQHSEPSGRALSEPTPRTL